MVWYMMKDNLFLKQQHLLIAYFRSFLTFLLSKFSHPKGIGKTLGGGPEQNDTEVQGDYYVTDT